MSLLERPRTLAPAAPAGLRPSPTRTRVTDAPGTSRSSGAPPADAPAAASQVALSPRPARDPFLDLLRALGTVAVVVAHWLMPQTSWDGSTLTVLNVLGQGPGWAVTWLVQLIPLMFFVAGAATASQMAARPSQWLPFVRTRLSRLVPPVAVFLGTWAVLSQVLPALGVPQGAVTVAATIAPQLLWYLGVYVVLLALSHVLLAAYRRWSLGAVVALGAAAVLVDVLRFAGGLEVVGVANVVLVWSFAYMLGFAYADGRLTTLSRRTTALVGAVGFAAMVLAVTVGPYPRSMVGMPGDTISNMAPPTLCLVALTLVQVFGALTLRPVLVRLSAAAPVRSAVGWVSARSMTLYLWHLTAMFVVVGVVTVGARVDLPSGWTAEWWAGRPLWFAACAVVLLALVRLLEPVERLRWSGPGSRTAAGAAPRPARR